MRLAILSTHPIQYYAPLFKALAETAGIDIRVFYGWRGMMDGGHDDGFGQAVQWDIPLLDGYESEFVENVSPDPGTHHYRGIDLPTLHARIDDWKPDAILVYGWNFKAHLKAIRRFRGKVPVLFRGDSTLLDERPGVKRLLRRLVLRWVYSNVDGAFPVGTQNRQYFEAMGLKPGQLFFAPHAIDNDRFNDSASQFERKAAEWRVALGIPSDAPTVLFVGKLEAKKAPHDLLSAFRSDQETTDCHLIFAGSGPQETSLREAAGPNVHFIGFQNQGQMPIVYRLGDLTVLPSRGPGETWGLAINEAMACSRAVAASSQVGCSRDLVRPGKNGWYFRAGDLTELESVLREASEVGREGLKAKGAESLRIIQNWSIREQAERITDGVRSVCS